jgi:uncharacterized protein (TIGR02145 family)
LPPRPPAPGRPAGGRASQNGTDESVFSALPGGFRDITGDFFGLGEEGRWWTATEKRRYSQLLGGYIDESQSYILRNDKDSSNDHKAFGMSVRCVKN